MLNLRPLPGYMIVQLEALFQNAGLIKIPERYKKAPHLVGRIIAISIRPKDRMFLGVPLAVGNRIIVTNLGGRFICEDTWLYPITLKRKDERGRRYTDSGVLAIVSAAVNMAPHSQDIPRCAFCGPVNDSNQNIMLSRGICPRCGLTKNGEKPDNSIKISDEHVEAFREAEQQAWRDRKLA